LLMWPPVGYSIGTRGPMGLRIRPARDYASRRAWARHFVPRRIEHVSRQINVTTHPSGLGPPVLPRRPGSFRRARHSSRIDGSAAVGKCKGAKCTFRLSPNHPPALFTCPPNQHTASLPNVISRPPHPILLLHRRSATQGKYNAVALRACRPRGRDTPAVRGLEGAARRAHTCHWVLHQPNARREDMSGRIRASSGAHHALDCGSCIRKYRRQFAPPRYPHSYRGKGIWPDPHVQTAVTLSLVRT